MELLGIGIDLIEVERIRLAFQRYGRRFQNRIFTPNEVEFCSGRPDPYQSYAARFAAKEAFAKALGTGLRGAVRWRDIQIDDNERSRPTITTFGRAHSVLGRRPVHLSLSHTAGHAAAIVIIEEVTSL